MSDLFTRLRRWPDIEGPDLLAADPADRLILDEAAVALEAEPGLAREPGAVVVLGDLYGALTLGAAAQLGAREVRVHTDDLVSERALAANAHRVDLDEAFSPHPELTPEVVRDAHVVLLRLPRSLDALREVTGIIADHAAANVRVFAGSRVKYMTHAMNSVLGERFDSVEASLARSKSRVLRAAGPTPSSGVQGFPKSERHDDVGLTICAHGAAFAGTKLDIGTRLLLEHLDAVRSASGTAVDLGCGTGVLAVALARKQPELEIIATDQSAAAVASARATAVANRVDNRVRVLRDDAMSTLADASVDAIVCNPPFHIGSTISTAAASKMFRAAARVLRPGGELLTVFNSHLRYRAELERVIGRTEQIARNPKFTVTRSTRR